MKALIVNQYNYLMEGNNIAGEKASLKPSLTIPGQTLSLHELLERFVRGENVEVFEPLYTDDDLIPDNVENMDFFQRTEMAEAMKQELDLHVQDLESKRLAKEAQKKVKKEEPRIEPTDAEVVE